MRTRGVRGATALRHGAWGTAAASLPYHGGGPSGLTGPANWPFSPRSGGSSRASGCRLSTNDDSLDSKVGPLLRSVFAPSSLCSHYKRICVMGISRVGHGPIGRGAGSYSSRCALSSCPGAQPPIVCMPPRAASQVKRGRRLSRHGVLCPSESGKGSGNLNDQQRLTGFLPTRSLSPSRKTTSLLVCTSGFPGCGGFRRACRGRSRRGHQWCQVHAIGPLNHRVNPLLERVYRSAKLVLSSWRETLGAEHA
jgi:hypothetical protein